MVGHSDPRSGNVLRYHNMKKIAQTVHMYVLCFSQYYNNGQTESTKSLSVRR